MKLDPECNHESDGEGCCLGCGGTMEREHSGAINCTGAPVTLAQSQAGATQKRQTRRVIKALRELYAATETGYLFPSLRAHVAITLMVMTNTPTVAEALTA